MSLTARALKQPKDADAPKKSLSAYFLFAKERRVSLKAEKPSTKFTEFSKMMGAEWKAMDAATKSKYQELAAEAKREYLLKLEEYRKTAKYEQFVSKLKTWKLENKGSRGMKGMKAAKKPKDGDAPKRP